MKLRRILAGAAATMAAAGITVGTPGTANAAAWENCPVGYFCLYEHGNGMGDVRRGAVEVPNVGSYWNDKASSLWNRTEYTVCVFEHANWQGSITSFGSGAQMADLKQWNDRITSHTWPSAC